MLNLIEKHQVYTDFLVDAGYMSDMILSDLKEWSSAVISTLGNHLIK